MKKQIIPIVFSIFLATMTIVSSCEGEFINKADADGGGEYYGEAMPGDAYGDSGAPVGDGGGSGNQSSGESGVLTAGEWNDLDNWAFWGGLMTDTFKDFFFYWGMNTSSRIAIKVTDANGAPVIGTKAQLKDASGNVLWTSVTDNEGKANLWADAFTAEGQTVIGNCTVTIGGTQMEGNPTVSDWSADPSVTVNEYTLADAASPSKIADIAFIVDATGSMGDEIDFLREDLLDILNKVAALQTDKTIYTGTVFYRDVEDDYVTKFSEFTTNFKSTVSFVAKQAAEGGGDTPEAVETALETTLSKLQWHSGSYANLAFLVLDAPAHKNPAVVESLQKSIAEFSAKGIRIIPVFCSSYEKDAEFMSRDLAILTGGTYVFLTNDSGVGGEHLEASVGAYKVEKLNDLLVRLITEYLS